MGVVPYYLDASETMMGKNIAKPIKGFPGYWIYPCGIVFSILRKNIYKKKIIKPSRSGHKIIKLFKIGNRFYKNLHRLVLETFIGPCPKGMECRHLDGNPENNNIKNLCWGTHSENMKDMFKHGRSNKGKDNPNYKHGRYCNG